MENKKITVTLCILNVLKSLLLVSQALVTKFLINYATATDLSKEEKISKVTDYSLILGSMIILLVIIVFIYNFIKKKAALNIEVKLKKRIFSALLNKDIQSLKKYHSGEISNVYLADVSNILQGEVETIPAIFLYVSRFVLAFAALIYIDFRLLIILLAIGIIAFVCARIYSKHMKKVAKQALESDGKVNAYMQEGYENIKVIKAMQAEDNIVDGLDKTLDTNYKIKNHRNNVSLVGNVGINTVMNISYGIALIYGAFAIAKNIISYGDFAALIQIVSYFETPLSMFASVLSRLASYNVSKKRIQDLMDLPEDTKTKETEDFDSIEIENLSFAYDKPIFENFDLSIKKGEKVILKGPSGRGKSTLFNLMLGFLTPENGTLNIIINGEKYPLSEYKSIFSYVSQENILFSQSIRENIQLFVKDVSEEDMINALKVAEVYEEIATKEKGLDTPLQERGGGLSLGQIQRVLLAICLLKNRPVLLLDEFTSSLDKKLESKIVENLTTLNKTMIIISHRDIKIEGVKVVDLGEN